MNPRRQKIYRMVLSALFLALGYVLPFLTGQIPEVGGMLCPMHIPVLLCGYVCGPLWGATVGFVVPLFRSLTLGAPALFPKAACMAAELAVYGLTTGLMHRILPRKKGFLYVSLLTAMVAGRLVWGAAMFLCIGTGFGLNAFLAGAIFNALPGITLQILLIPVIVVALQRLPAVRRCMGSAYRCAEQENSPRYAPFLPFLEELDRKLAQKDRVILAIEGGSAAGKSTLGAWLQERYDCTLLHMDDFFLQPAQRTPERLAEVGGNVDRERFLAEVLLPLYEGRAAEYRRYDCATATLLPAVRVEPARLVVVEGAYSMHPELAPYYDLSVFLHLSPTLQRQRILKRNAPDLAERFFGEWIPMEERYFAATEAAARCTLRIDVSKSEECTETV